MAYVPVAQRKKTLSPFQFKVDDNDNLFKETIKGIPQAIVDVPKKFLRGGLFEGGIFSPTLAPETFKQAFLEGIEKRKEVIARQFNITDPELAIQNVINFMPIGSVSKLTQKEFLKFLTREKNPKVIADAIKGLGIKDEQIIKSISPKFSKAKTLQEVKDILLKTKIPSTAPIVTDITKRLTGRYIPVAERGIVPVPKVTPKVVKAPQPLAVEARKFKTVEIEPKVQLWQRDGTLQRRIDVVKVFQTPIGQKVLQNEISKLSKNSDGSITAYRVGEIRGDITSVTTSKSVADGYAKHGFDLPTNKEFNPPRLIREVRINPDKIKAVISTGNKEGELFVKSSQLTDIFNKTKGKDLPALPKLPEVKRPPTAERILGIEKAPLIKRREDVALREKLRAEIRGAKTGIAQFKREQSFLETIKKNITKELNKPKGRLRSTASFIKQLGEFNQTAITDIKKELGIIKPISQMKLPELNEFVGKLKERLKFKRERGFKPSLETIQKLGIKPPKSKQPIISDRVYEANTEAQKVTVRTKVRDVIQKTRDEVDKTLGTISSRLADIDPSLRVQLRRFIFKSNQQVIRDKKITIPLLDKMNDMSKTDFSIFDFAAKNGDITKQNEIIKKYGMEKEIKETRALLDNLYTRANDVGFDIGYRKNYFPRMVKDTKGLVQFFSEADSEVKSIIDEATKRKENDLGRALSTDEKAYLINNMIRGYSGGQITLSALGNMKNRVIDFITPEMNKFYHDTSTSLIQYTESTNRAIEARKFFGKSRIVDKKVDQFNNIDDSIGGYVLDLLAKGKITPKQELELREILNAFFGEKSTRGVVSLYKNLAYIDVMGSPINALTQIGDLAFPVYNVLVGNAGAFDTARAFARAVGGKSKITKEDIGIEKIATEFESTSKSANAVDFVFRMTGLTKIDSIGKEVLINPMVARHQKLAKNPTPEFIKEMKLIFEDETEQLIVDLKSGEITENVKFLSFYKLLDFQPVAFSEVPERYLTGGNWRILYQLKTWTLKMFDVFRNEGFRKMETNKVEGIRNIILLAMSLVTMNATADTIKDVVLGRKTKLNDLVVDNFATLIGFSRYSVNQIARDGLGTTLIEQVTPPTQAVDNISKDLIKIYKDWDKGVEISKLKTLKSIPIGGNLYYWWFGKGADYKDRTKKRTKKSTLGLPTLPKLPALPKLPSLPSL